MKAEAVLSDNGQQKDTIVKILRQIADKIEQGSPSLDTTSFEAISLDIRITNEQKRKVKCSINLDFLLARDGQNSTILEQPLYLPLSLKITNYP